MRMFLVGMCDIFLLLYLTALAQVDERGVSDLTVADYTQLQSSQEVLKQTASERDKLTREVRRRRW